MASSQLLLGLDQVGTSATDHMDFLRCFLCDRAYTKPKLLSCLHSFCQRCLEDHLSVQQLEAEQERLTGGGAGPESELSPRSEGSVSGSDTGSEDDPPSLPTSLTCPMCKTTTEMTPSGIEGFKDNLLIVEMVRRWEEKLFGENTHNKADKSNCAHKVDNVKDMGKCSCLPEWKNIANGTVMSRKVVSEIEGCDNGFKSEGIHTADMGTKKALVAKHMDENADTQYYCVTCDIMICAVCRQCSHCDHQTKTVADATAEKRDYLENLLSDLRERSNKCETSMLQVDNSHQHLLTSTEHIVKEIEERSARLIEVIQARRNQLIDELGSILKHHEQKLTAVRANISKDQDKLRTAAKFARDLLEYGTSSDVMYLNSDVSGRLHELLNEQNNNGVDVANVRLEVPESGHDEAHLIKTFGSLVQGEVKCGSAELLKSFDLELKWPTGMASTKNKEFVVTGKMGAFEEKGKVMFFGRAGTLKTVTNLDENCIPYDTTVTGDGSVLVADNTGTIHKFDSSGNKVETMTGKFKGVGRLAPLQHSWGHFVVTSSEEKRVHVYKDNGELSLTIPSSPYTDEDDVDNAITLDHPHYVATNHNNDIIISDFEQNAVYAFDSGGAFLFKYEGSGIEGGSLKCPSAVCCDNFDNILIADFMNDRVHLVSQSGQFLGYLLTREDHVSCPNFLSIDGDGHLFVGQYGGQIQVFQYMSYVKFV